jgi:N4-gp56 family major capsid protein
MADMGKTEVTSAVLQDVSKFVQAELKQKAKLMPLVQNFPVGPGMDSVRINRAGGFAAADKVENVSLTAQVITFAADILNLDRHKAVLVRLEDIAGLQSNVNTVGEILSRMSTELALQIDRDIEAQLRLTSAAAPDHRIAYAATSLKKADILEARKLLHIQNVPFNECYMGVSPAQEVSLLAVDDFVHVDKYGSSEAIMNGEIGRLYGCKVIMSNVFDDARTLVWHPTHCAFGMQQNLTFKTADDLPNVAKEYLAVQLYGAKVLDLGVRGVLLGSAS